MKHSTDRDKSTTPELSVAGLRMVVDPHGMRVWVPSDPADAARCAERHEANRRRRAAAGRSTAPTLDWLGQ